MKIFFVASIYSHFTAFHIPYMKYLQSIGYEVWAAAGLGREDREILELINVKCVNVPFSRNPFDFKNIKAFYALKKIFKSEQFELVHVHTPVASLITRAAFRNSKIGKMLYTVHGFHFFKGAPKLNWIIYYTAEKLAAKWTDYLITINEEDYRNAYNLLPVEKVSLVHGVGVEILSQRIEDIEKKNLKEKLGLNSQSVVISYIAELNENKNHKFLLRNWSAIKQKNPNYELLIIGTGKKEMELKAFVEKEQLQGVHFLGYRRDVPVLLQISDIITLLSYREGLPKSIMEAMVAGIPCVVSNTRGLRDLVKPKGNGFVVNHDEHQDLVEAFTALNQKQLRIEMGYKSKIFIEPFLIGKVLEEYKVIYKRLLN
ncbi:colanic acid biosynthesis glycosyltransferase WcaL [Solibacillus isronensis B3W22]|uniref:Colanic acid biosynthesis glycosyltransferase WcaL n=1 Tax=Solibacillus isronensis B3W22 TaxID=1224748 RepID=K1KW98_9BACL|nr:glycosyltransferase family 4 protein [Solibacillus isronensis]AMO84784.1 glycosyl transferase family 1 [Solibacillus silvestris]EKB46776.1 colanic acid biosynthesis glycosyltransferase WcaL [Solibacillus isronensis B3W22]